MFKRTLEGFLGVVAISMLFLTVSCSHTKRNTSQLDGLSAEDAVTEATNEPTEANNAEVVAEANTSDASTEAAPEESAPAMTVARTESDFAVPGDEAAESSSTNAPFNDSVVSSSTETVANAVTNSAVSEDLKAVSENPVQPESVVVASTQDAPGSTLFDSELKAGAVTGSAPDKNNSKENASGQRSPASTKKKQGRSKKAKDNTADADITNGTVTTQAEGAAAAPEKELASASLNAIIERNLLWIAFGIVGGVITAFFAVRRNRRSNDHLS